MSARKLLITGGTGDFGRPLLEAAVRDGWDVVATVNRNVVQQPKVTCFACDLGNRDAVIHLITQEQPDVIVHSAVSERSSGFETLIPDAAGNFAYALQGTATRFVFISTDVVFDGKNPPYSEDSETTPYSAYGRAKVAAESVVREIANSLIVRTSLIYDFTAEGHQARWMLEKVARGEKVPLFTDQVRQPIWSLNLAHAVLEAAQLDTKGVVHIAGPQQLTREVFGRKLLRVLGYNPDEVIEQASAIGKPQPLDVTLNLERAFALLQTPLLTFEQALSACQQHLDDRKSMI